NTIYKGIKSIKFLNEQTANELYELANTDKYLNEEVSYLELLIDIIERTNVNTRQVKILIELGFFDKFGKREIMSNLWDVINDKGEPSRINEKYKDRKAYPLKYSKTHVSKTKEKRIANIKEYVEDLESNPPDEKTIYEQIQFEIENLGYANTTFPQ